MYASGWNIERFYLHLLGRSSCYHTLSVTQRRRHMFVCWVLMENGERGINKSSMK